MESCSFDESSSRPPVSESLLLLLLGCSIGDERRHGVLLGPDLVVERPFGARLVNVVAEPSRKLGGEDLSQIAGGDEVIDEARKLVGMLRKGELIGVVDEGDADSGVSVLRSEHWLVRRVE